MQVYTCQTAKSYALAQIIIYKSEFGKLDLDPLIKLLDLSLYQLYEKYIGILFVAKIKMRFLKRMMTKCE